MKEDPKLNCNMILTLLVLFLESLLSLKILLLIKCIIGSITKTQ